MTRSIYVASRVKHAQMWKTRRDEGMPIISTWIDEAGEGESASIEGLWVKILDEIRKADVLLLYVEKDDFPIKGALVEVGMALAMKKKVYVCLHMVDLEPHSMRPVGSWMCHPLVTLLTTEHVDSALHTVCAK